MTRLASIMGVATVATLVLLSGCESATAKKDTDFAAALAGTWMTAELDGSVDKPTEPPEIALLVAHITDDNIAVKSRVTAIIEDGAGSNAGTFRLTVSSVPTDEQLKMSLAGVIGASAIVTSAEGTINVEDDSKMKVTLTEISTVPPAFAPPAAVALKDMETPFGYVLTDDQLKLSSLAFVGLGFVASPDEQITFAKQTEQ